MTRHAWHGPAYLSAAAGGVAMLIVALAAWPLVVALAMASPESSGFDLASLDARGEAHDRSYDEKLLAQLDGRSVFFVPAEPPPPPPPPRVDDGSREERPPPPPSRYGGPELVAIFYDQAWFKNGVRVGVGEESSGVEVLELAPPWHARVRWRGVDFTIELFERDKVVLPKK